MSQASGRSACWETDADPRAVFVTQVWMGSDLSLFFKLLNVLIL